MKKLFGILPMLLIGVLTTFSQIKDSSVMSSEKVTYQIILPEEINWSNEIEYQADIFTESEIKMKYLDRIIL